MQVLSPSELGHDVLVAFVQTLGFCVDGDVVTDKDGAPIVDPYIGENVHIDNIFIAKGSTIILDNNPVSIAGYLQEYGDPLEE